MFGRLSRCTRNLSIAAVDLGQSAGLVQIEVDGNGTEDLMSPSPPGAGPWSNHDEPRLALGGLDQARAAMRAASS